MSEADYSKKYVCRQIDVIVQGIEMIAQREQWTDEELVYTDHGQTHPCIDGLTAFAKSFSLLGS